MKSKCNILDRLQKRHSQKENNKLEDRTEVLIHFSPKTKEKYGRTFKKYGRLIERLQYFSNISCKRENRRNIRESICERQLLVTFLEFKIIAHIF